MDIERQFAELFLKELKREYLKMMHDHGPSMFIEQADYYKFVNRSKEVRETIEYVTESLSQKDTLLSEYIVKRIVERNVT